MFANSPRANLTEMALTSKLNPNAKEFVPSASSTWIMDTSEDCNSSAPSPLSSSQTSLVNEMTIEMEESEREEELSDTKVKTVSEEISGDSVPDSKSQQNCKVVSKSQHSAQLWKDLLDEFNGKGRQLHMMNVFVGYQSKNVVVKLICRNKPECQKQLEESIVIDLSESSTLELKAENLLAAKLFQSISSLIHEKIVESAEYSGCSEYSEDEIAHQIEHIKMLETVFSKGRKSSTDESIVQCALGELCKELGIPEKEIDATSDASNENLSQGETDLVSSFENESNVYTSDHSFKSYDESGCGSKLYKYQNCDGCELHVNQMSDCEDKMDCYDETYLLEAPPTTPAVSRTDVSIKAMNKAMKSKMSKGSTLNGAIRKTRQAVLGSTFKRNCTTEAEVPNCRCTAGANRLFAGCLTMDTQSSSRPRSKTVNDNCKLAKCIPNRNINSKVPYATVECNAKKVTPNRHDTCAKNLNDKSAYIAGNSKSTKIKRNQLNGVRGSLAMSGCRQIDSKKVPAIWKL